MAKISTVEQNASIAIQQVTQTSQELLKNIDRGFFQEVQPYINKLYTGPIGHYMAKTILGIPLGNILAAFLAFTFVILLRKILTRHITRFLLYLTHKTETQLDDIIVNELKRPIRFLFVIIAFDLAFQFLFLDNRYTQLFLSTLLIVDIYWVFYAFTPALQKFLDDYSDKNPHLSRELGEFLVRIIRFLIIFTGLVSVLYNFGINVSAFLASLGLGGLAFALAAKDTAANLFGSIALMLDQSIKIGEWIKVNGVEGIVEDIGMRTTKIRTFEKSFVVVPNSIVANTNIENFSRRGIRRIKMSIGLTYDTPGETIRQIAEEIREMLQTHPGIAHDQTLMVRFDRFNPSDLGIFIYTFTNTSDWEKYLEIREDINLKIMEIVEKNGTDFAFPSQSIYVEKLPDNQVTKQ
ncbi:mechanosensitive ion channel family protein [Nitratifractor salsuginis]|uniref:MscS Mechanosensitive ion channel n=1 Tax=Nitratifractor salsuginis (strain DSM 16511 / JCM 12458 / E9I37-1) TaxID=749222 RepID=E6X1I4_NITSE|nr:mechanosensitive ion channel family protein [Nitratifractor salsuginis]ADV45917.1 MscS Mechanosensitive ion channel [Nitratifractor salsuginis DSM 16511]